MAHNLPVPSIRGNLKKLLPYLLQAQEQNLNEADTNQRVVKFLEEVLGYDPMTEISRESLLKGKYVDITVKLDGIVKFFVEVKAAGMALRDRHTDQARSYAAEGNIRWVVLTNGTSWVLYHLTFEEGIEHDRVFTVELTANPDDEAFELIALLHRESIRKGLHEEFWRRHSALGAASLGQAIFTESVLRLIRREIRRVQGVSIDEETLVSAVKELFSADAREQMGPVKVRRRRKKKQREPDNKEVSAEVAEQGNGEGEHE